MVEAELTDVFLGMGLAPCALGDGLPPASSASSSPPAPWSLWPSLQSPVGLVSAWNEEKGKHVVT